jgi:hypothetical protein
VLRVGVLLFASGWGANHFVPLLLVYRARMNLSPVDLGTLFAVYALGLIPGLLVGGPLSDRRGRRAVVLPAALLALGGTALLAAATNGFALLLAGRLVVGLGSGGVFSAGTAWVQDLSPGTPPGTGARRAAVALSAGFGGGPLIASACAQWFAGPALVPYLLQAAALGAAIAFAWRVPGAAKPAAPGAAAGKPGEPGEPGEPTTPAPIDGLSRRRPDTAPDGDRPEPPIWRRAARGAGGAGGCGEGWGRVYVGGGEGRGAGIREDGEQAERSPGSRGAAGRSRGVRIGRHGRLDWGGGERGPDRGGGERGLDRGGGERGLGRSDRERRLGVDGRHRHRGRPRHGLRDRRRGLAVLG